MLVTGGTGSLGWAVAHAAAGRGIDAVVIYSRNEAEQARRAAESVQPECDVRWRLGDVRDEARLRLAMRDCDAVVHCAALKRVESCERDPIEAVKTNVFGTQNVITAAIDANIKSVVTVSTDKAVSPDSLYGASKLCADRLTLAANAYSNTRFAVVRLGNIAWSRGSVLPIWAEEAARGNTLTITDPGMTRFLCRQNEAAGFVLDRATWVLDLDDRRLFVPSFLRAVSVEVLANAAHPGADWKVTGRRPGERMHECLATTEEAAQFGITGPLSSDEADLMTVKEAREWLSASS